MTLVMYDAKPIKDMTREELIEALEQVARANVKQREDFQMERRWFEVLCNECKKSR